MNEPTKHQKRVLAALLALERTHNHSWWSRDAIGAVVRAGGFHAIIQNNTMDRLREGGLVQWESESWTPEVRSLIRCNCACHNWGLTDEGRAAAESLYIRLSDADRKALDRVKGEAINWTERMLEGEDEE